MKLIFGVYLKLIGIERKLFYELLPITLKNTKLFFFNHFTQCRHKLRKILKNSLNKFKQILLLKKNSVRNAVTLEHWKRVYVGKLKVFIFKIPGNMVRPHLKEAFEVLFF